MSSEGKGEEGELYEIKGEEYWRSRPAEGELQNYLKYWSLVHLKKTFVASVLLVKRVVEGLDQQNHLVDELHVVALLLQWVGYQHSFLVVFLVVLHFSLLVVFPIFGFWFFGFLEKGKYEMKKAK